MQDLRIVTGTANPKLAHDIAHNLGIRATDVGPAGLKIETDAMMERFADGEIRVQVQESVRGMDVFLVQPTCPPTSENIMELLILLDAIKRASARRCTAVIPYYGYARQEKKTKPREPIAARLMADLIGVAGANRALLVDVHVQTIQGFFGIPVDLLPAGPLFAEYFSDRDFDDGNTAVVSPDVGGVGRATVLADRLKATMVVIAKRRPEPNKCEVMEVIGSVEGKRVLIVDDIVDTAGSLTEGAQALAGRGAKEIWACATHGVLSGPAIQRLKDSPITKLVITDTIPLPPEKQCEKIHVLSVATVMAEAIFRIHEDQSLSTIYDRYWMQESR